MGIQDADFIAKGQGPTVILIHSSVAGAGQWRKLMDDLADQFHLIAVNLFGYGKTDSWAQPREQTLHDQAMLLESLIPDDGNRVSIVGHSIGGSVAMKAAALFREKVDKLVLLEPNPFYLLKQAGRLGAYDEAVLLRNTIKEAGASGDWQKAAALFADYWTGEGSWAAMPDDRKSKFATMLKPNFHEWDAVMHNDVPISYWLAHLPARTTVVSASDTVRTIREIVELMRDGCPGWRFEKLTRGGHMAPLTSSEMVNPIVRTALS